MSLTQAIFYNFFHNVKKSYEMKVKKIIYFTQYHLLVAC